MSSTEPPQPWVDAGAEAHDPALYDPAAFARPIGPDQALTENGLAFYREHGYLAVESLLSPAEVDQALETIDRLVTGGEEGWRRTMYEAAVRSELDRLDTPGRRDAVRKLAFYDEEARQCGLPVHHERLIAIVHHLLGTRDSELFQAMTLLKPPRIGREKPWHQDHAYFNLALSQRVVGVWVALDEATLDNGCMHLLDGGHRLGPIHHWKRRDWQICDTDILGQRSVAAPLKPGGALFFDSLLPHGTPSNHSPKRRRALQFHYAPAGCVRIPEEQRLAVFGTEGKDVEC